MIKFKLIIPAFLLRNKSETHAHATQSTTGVIHEVTQIDSSILDLTTIFG